MRPSKRKLITHRIILMVASIIMRVKGQYQNLLELASSFTVEPEVNDPSTQAWQNLYDGDLSTVFEVKCTGFGVFCNMTASFNPPIDIENVIMISSNSAFTDQISIYINDIFYI